MSQWKRTKNGNRVHKRQCKRRACAVYFYKDIYTIDELLPFFDECIVHVYTARPKRIGASSFWFGRRS